ncbi:hypothetical protein EIN_284770 [Entamoeba invadens IP1]|uniref:C2 domain-containing protein n=1 Tax=Entamoeba invadens IP1 TaxID=370355 RepID=L7FJU8_ENTIV|nr:hypothetical protein EIN_284770 [Entamoeba invadens IP1]ELP84891.1 hypothetical protein EIN_284770 [Entamoeba invadens IP1]|eukprot:XP_004184237.1 hypothetical protein EIN_284770 [Entamoeba invadens IP1]
MDKNLQVFGEKYNLEIQILSAKLTKIDKGDCDPYASCKVGEVKYRTETAKKTTDPIWNGPPMILEITPQTKEIVVSVNKHGYLGNKIELGSAKIILSRLGNDISTTSWYDLLMNNEKIGTIQCKFKRQKGKTEESEIEKGWTDMLSSVHAVLKHHPLTTAEVQYYMGSEKKAETPSKREKVLGPISGFVKIEIDAPILDFSIGQKGTYSVLIPPTLELPHEFWLEIFPDGLVVSKTPRKPTLVPLFNFSVEHQYYTFLISDTKKVVEGQTVFFPVAIGFVSPYPLYEVMRRMLLVIYENCPSSEESLDIIDFPDENTKSPTAVRGKSNTVLSNAQIVKGIYELMNVESLAYGGYVKYKYGNLNIELRLPLKYSLPSFNTTIYPMFSIFNVSGVTTIFLLLMTNLKIIVFAQSQTLLTTIIDNMVSLLFPFPPTQKVFPILPYKNLNVLSGSDTFIAGVPLKYREEAMKQIGEEEHVVVDLELGTIDIKVSKEQLEFPVEMTVELQNELNNAYKEKYFEMDQLGNEPYDDRYFSISTSAFNMKVRIAFFRFLTRLLEGYDEYINFVWVADKVVYDFDVFSFFFTKSFDCEPLIKHFCESGTFMSFIQEEGAENVAAELINFYSKTKKIINITPTNANIIKEYRDIGAFSIDWKDLKKLREGESSIRLTKQMQRDKTYVNELDKLKNPREKAKEKHVWVAVFERYVDDLIRGEEGDMTKVYHCVSNQAGRHLLLKILSERGEKMKSKGCLEEVPFQSVVGLMKTLVEYCRSDHDIETPLGIIDVATKYCCKVDSMTYKFVIDELGMAEVWNNKKIWYRAFNQGMVQFKRTIYGELYNNKLEETWKTLPKEQQDKFREKEENGLITTLHIIAKNMKIIGLNDKVINEVIEYCEDYVHVGADVRAMVINVLRVIIENDSKLLR